MATDVIQGYLFAWSKNQRYGERLVADLNEEQMILQPASNLESPSNHPAWVLSHLNAYLPVVTSIIQGELFDDPKLHRFGMDSAPEADRTVYASKDDLIQEFVTGHESIAKLLGESDDSVFSKEIQLERWKPVMPIAGVALPYLMLNHENGHLGQISAWRRIQGMPSV